MDMYDKNKNRARMHPNSFGCGEVGAVPIRPSSASTTNSGLHTNNCSLPAVFHKLHRRDIYI